MKLNTTYLSNNNSYDGQIPLYIVIHNTDNFSEGADAKAHAKAQYNGNFDSMSAHVYVDDKEAYQTLPFNRGAWHVGVDYGGRLFGTVNNRNSVGIEVCVQKDFNYEKAFLNAVEICSQIMKTLKIPAERVIQHYDVCAKNCPSVIRQNGDWNRFKSLILKKETVVSEEKKITVPLTERITVQFPELSEGCTGSAVQMLQVFLKIDADGVFGENTRNSLQIFQKNTNQKQDGICGKNSWKAIIEYMKRYTFL